jgi:glycosyltransferase involved in cell wall biosynthesis
MNPAVRFLFASGEAFPPDFHGGAELSVAELALELGGRGHECAVVAGVPSWERAARGLLRRGVRPPTDVRVRRAAFPGRTPALVADEIRAARPDVVMAWNTDCARIAHTAVDLGVPVIVWVPDVDFRRYLGRLPRRRVRLAASSAFVAGRIRAVSGMEARVLRPVIRLDEYRAAARRPDAVTLINPRRAKGVGVALRTAARLRHRRFTLAGPSHITPHEQLALAARLVAHPNVTWHRPLAHARDAYARAAVLLVPSQVEDASPRVILEAQVNDIPVVASRTGGIPETMGEGGVLVDPRAPAEAWAAAVESILGDAARAADLAAKGRANLARRELGAAAIADEFLALAEEVAG